MGLVKGHVYDSGPLLFKLPGERLAALVAHRIEQNPKIPIVKIGDTPIGETIALQEVDKSNNICAIGKS